ncbi:hypothetical protein [Effusibacillus consociatus]|uniref:YtxH domain-containing protein n=1 Tax=Effusibacillus consociatus TaxID=1117041 RepID=A0ABV9Q5B4_9BACL
MWEMVSNLIPAANRMLPGRRNRGLNTATAMLIGAGIGIATWEMMRRTNPVGNMMNRKMNNMVDDTMDMNVPGIDNSTMAKMADEVMDAIK